MRHKCENQENVSVAQTCSSNSIHMPVLSIIDGSQYCCAKPRLCCEAQWGRSDAVPLLTQASVKPMTNRLLLHWGIDFKSYSRSWRGIESVPCSENDWEVDSSPGLLPLLMGLSWIPHQQFKGESLGLRTGLELIGLFSSRSLCTATLTQTVV